MNVQLVNIGKRFKSEWIFRKVNHNFKPETITAILGPNGSGKSTLLQCAAGYVVPSEGELKYSIESQAINIEDVFKHLSIASPYINLNESLTLKEVVDLQRKFKPFLSEFTTEQIISISNLEAATNKAIQNFSSGMKQRLRLTLAILADSKLLFLDEPLSNLDKAGESWYHQMLGDYSAGRTIVICSNHHPAEIAPAQEFIEMSQFKVN
jgi:ABC-type multidrug transport system ATPase subunit